MEKKRRSLALPAGYSVRGKYSDRLHTDPQLKLILRESGDAGYGERENNDRMGNP